MSIHREGHKMLISLLIILALINYLGQQYLANEIAQYTILGCSIILFILVLQFFRIPYRKINANDNLVIAPADGKVVVIEEVEETEYFKDKRIQVSIFMSPLNVHQNQFPISGKVKYVKYHPGLFLVAWHPKSSTDNERTTVVVEHSSGKEVLFRQIAGAVARRIRYYCKEGDQAEQGKEFGFIKFGSRVDLLLPLDAKINVNINDTVKGKQSVIATF